MQNDRRSLNPICRRLLAAILVAAFLAGCGDWPIETPTPTSISLLDPTTAAPTPTASASPLPSAPPTASATNTSAATSTATLTPSPAGAPSLLPTETLPPPTEAPVPTPTATAIPLPTPDGITRTLQVPILMYHYISEPPADAGKVRRDLSVAPEQFRAHLQMLRTAGYETISLEQLVLALQVGQPLPPKPIILTFDDGYRDNYTEAFRILQEEGMIGTFFVITKMLDQERPEYLSWEMVTEMHQAGMEIGSHSYEHIDLAGTSEAYLVYQLLGSREAIEARIAEPVRFFCYPSGSYDEHTIRILHEANYWAAVSLTYGVEQRSDALYELQRIRVRGSYDAAMLALVIEQACEADTP